MEICREDYLNSFVTPEADGGWGLCEWIVSVMAENRVYTHVEIKEAIDASPLGAPVKALPVETIKDVCEWMQGKTFAGVTVGSAGKQRISYVPPE